MLESTKLFTVGTLVLVTILLFPSDVGVKLTLLILPGLCYTLGFIAHKFESQDRRRLRKIVSEEK